MAVVSRGMSELFLPTRINRQTNLLFDIVVPLKKLVLSPTECLGWTLLRKQIDVITE